MPLLYQPQTLCIRNHPTSNMECKYMVATQVRSKQETVHSSYKTRDPTKSDAQWRQRLDDLAQLQSAEGHCLVPSDHETSLGLFRRVAEQRAQYNNRKEGKTTSSTQEMPNSLKNSDFSFTGRRNYDEVWTARFSELQNFKACEGHCEVPQIYAKSPSLGVWVATQRSQYKYLQEGKPSNMTPQRIDLLESIGFAWKCTKRFDTLWTKRFEELKAFKARERHCFVPQGYTANPRLGQWVAVQRQQRKLMKEGKPSKMTHERLTALESLGFSWNGKNRFDRAWIKKLDELKEFKAREGHCDVPRSYKINPSLGKWVDNQRQQYKLLKEGSVSRLTEERMKILDDIGFTWKTRGCGGDAGWIELYNELKRFQLRRGHCDVPKIHKKYSHLAFWTIEQRRQYTLLKEGKPSVMTKERIKALEKIGFLWQVNVTTDQKWPRSLQDIKTKQLKKLLQEYYRFYVRSDENINLTDKGSEYMAIV